MQTQEVLQKLENQLCQITLVLGQKYDVHWKWNASGLFTVKSGYTAMKEGPKIKSSIKKAGLSKYHQESKVFGWLILDKILTIQNLVKGAYACLIFVYSVE